MFNQLFMPVLNKVHPVTMGEVRHNTQKERRIIDVLEPVMNQHRLVMDKKVIQKDFDSCQHLPPEQARRYQLMYQLPRLTADRGALTNDDRLDALAMACQYWVDAMAQDVEQRMGVRKEELMAAEINRLREQASMGFAVIAGHQSEKTTNSLRW